ncbi:MAG: pyruvate dehydrogenase complex dihydrolipoamide acetyltransferase [Bacteroidota bacterium]
MAEIIRMPLLSDTMEEGTIVAWNKSVGDTVEAGDILAEVETDKAVMEVESYFDGVLLYIGVEAGNAVPVDGVIAVIGEEGEDFKAQLEAEENASTSGSEESAPPKEEVQEDKAPAETTPTPEPATAGGDKRLKASPLARKMAQEEGIDLSQLTGSGDGGRVIKRDVLAYLESGAQTGKGVVKPDMGESLPSVPAFSMSAEESYEDVSLSQMRKTIARRLGESKFTAPHFYLTVEIDMKRAIEARKRMNEVAPVKISFNDLVVKACAVALHKHPDVNAAWMGDKIRYNKHVHVGVAVAVDEGLLVPVIRHADLKSLSQLNTEVRELAGKAKERKLSMDEMTGNTFTISNLGMFGIEEFTAIINPPDSCILAVGTIVEKPVVENGQIVVGHRMKVTLSCDHRVVDGAKGAQFLKTVRENLEEPVRLLV